MDECLSNGVGKVCISKENSSEQKWFIKAFVIEKPTDEEASFQNDKQHIKNYVRYLKTDLKDEQIVKDVTKDEMKAEFETISDTVKCGNYTHILLIFSAHGSVGKIKCNDDKKFSWLRNIDILKKEELRNIPKVIIIDTCQGRKENEVKEDGTCTDNIKPQKNRYIAKCLNFENFFYGFSTIEGYISPMDESGSPYLRCLFYQLLANAYDQSNKELEINLSHSHIETNAIVSKNKNESQMFMEMPCYFSTLLKPLIMRYKEINPRPTRVELQQEFNLKVFLEPIKVHED